MKKPHNYLCNSRARRSLLRGERSFGTLLFLKLCASDQGLARMRSYEEKKISAPSRSIEI